ncbi:hypothetical protein MHBO_000811 [Bonamia ostreae]|uniref:DNA-directed RNA polymerase subunit n=1 Tax=Bonamia ostreae TaxID=126728 RepID=A0ABV2AGW2_9EUKA
MVDSSKKDNEKLISFETLFCPKCESILSRPDLNNVISCYACNYNCLHSEFFSPEQISDQKEEIFTEEFYDCDDFSGDVVARPTVKFDCPECPSKKASYLALQMRSVDEGQTVFYECVDCGHKTRTDS